MTLRRRLPRPVRAFLLRVERADIQELNEISDYHLRRSLELREEIKRRKIKAIGGLKRGR